METTIISPVPEAPYARNGLIKSLNFLVPCKRCTLWFFVLFGETNYKRDICGGHLL